jgi:hypothetical protein
MQAARYEGSLLASLTELKAIEQQRVAEERAAVQRAEEIRIQEMADTERRHREQLEARAKADHEAELAVERAKLEAEREARLRIEAAEAAERSRQQAALEQDRAVQELALRRAEVAKKRPTWMIVVTGLSLAVAGLLVFFAISAQNASELSDKNRAQAEQDALVAKRDAEESKATLARLEAESKVLDGKVNEAIKRVAEATTRAQLEAANAELKRTQKAQAEAARARELARLEALRKERLGGAHVSAACANQSVCKDATK